MERAPFITPAMSILLDAVRAGAALVVLLGHMVQMGIYTGPFPLSEMMQHNAVIVFFVLSGLVIAHSVQTRSSTLSDYVIARAARILPVSLSALVFGTLIYLLVSSQGLLPALFPQPYDELSLAALLLPTVFLSESVPGGGPVWNPPYWSLVYEVWFYTLFAAAFFLDGRRRIAWLAVLSLVAGWRILLMLPIWLLGAALARYAGDWRLTRGKALQVALIGIIALLTASAFSEIGLYAMHALHASFGYDLKFSGYFLTDYVFGLGIALLFVAARPFAERGRARLETLKRPIRWLSGFSFSLYIFHWPMLSALSAYGVSAGESLLAFAALAGGIVGACALIATVTEYRSREIRSWMTRRFAGPGRAVAA